MPEKLGPHLLGRRPSPPDDRDWTREHLEALQQHAAALAGGSTLAEVRASAGDAWGWNWWEALWRIVKALFVPGPPPPIPPPPPSGDVLWPDPDVVLDQGPYGTCIGNGGAQWGNTLPYDDRFTEADARRIYYEATCLDGQCDDPDAPGGGQQGSTGRSLAKVLKTRNRIAAYAFGPVSDAVAWCRTHGPVIVCTDWTDGMWSPDAHGFVRPTGSVVGGHCYVLTGVKADGTLVFLNSWGAGWADHGRHYMTTADFTKLFASNGEAILCVELPV